MWASNTTRSTSFGRPPTTPGNCGGGASGSLCGVDPIQTNTSPWLSAAG
jgi:hypothetical protein